ncbi:hypothetical protein [Streptomyces muensis]|uniref:Cysteine-rich CPCC domain-containing protein n=1 Tax=Streptomyces muensis TaxID=1077944 RepID=A0A9X1PRW4_STRM4|nr:hypothetical protein [Streptomyces muensis]MCF1592387.1 hypothetical protein [Streptomyces muensis]
MTSDPRPSIVCPECGSESWHPKDVEEGYCGRCSWWTGDPLLYAAWKAEREPAGLLEDHYGEVGQKSASTTAP